MEPGKNKVHFVEIALNLNNYSKIIVQLGNAFFKAVI